MPTKNIFRKTNRPLVNAKSACLVAMSVLSIGGFLCGSFSPVVKADTYDDQINALRSQNNEYQSQANILRARAGTLAEEIAILTREKDAIQANINSSVAQVEKLKKDIIDLQNKIEENKKALGEVLAQIYLAEQVSGIERLASSKNLAEYLDAEVARNNIQDTLNKKLNEIKAQKIELENTQKKIEIELKAQEQQKAQLVAKEDEKNRILAETKGNEAAYNNLVAVNNNQISKISSAQKAYYESLRRSDGRIPTASATGPITFKNYTGEMYCGGGYSYCGNSHDEYVSDNWGLSLARECVHYTADSLTRLGYKIPYRAFGGGRGNAYSWVPVSTGGGFAHVVSNPQAGDVAYMSTGPYGHVGMVEANLGNGWVRISQFNFAGDGRYSEMDLQIGRGTQFLRFYK